MRHIICTIVGRKETSARWTEALGRQAELAGLLAARVGFTVCTGGHSGVMRYAAKGAKAGGALTLGILTTEHHGSANEFIDLALPSGMGVIRNALTALACDAMLGLPGGWGTVQEMTFAHEYGRPVFSWASHKLDGEIPFEDDDTRTEKVEAWLRQQYQKRRAELERSA